MHPKIRVARIFSRLNIGGPSLHVILLTERLNPQRFETVLLIGHEGLREGNMLQLAHSRGVDPVEIPCLGRELSIWDDFRATIHLWRLLRRLKPAIVHTHTSKAGFTGRLAAMLAGVPIVVHTFHGHVFEGYFGSLLTSVFVRIERILANKSDAVITISAALKNQLLHRKIGSEEKIRTIELGLDLDPFLAIRGPSNVLRARLSLAENVRLVGVIGRLVPIKDHRTFLSAAALVAKEMNTVHFVIVGDGELLNSLKRLSGDLGLDARVHFTGWMYPLAEIYADLDVVVISSRNEGTPVSLIEGAASCKPLIATRVGGIPDMIHDGQDGLIVSPADPQCLAGAILKVLRDPDMASQLALRARERARFRYAASRLVSEIESLYLDLLHRKGLYLQECR